jgi:hypothetical protein
MTRHRARFPVTLPTLIAGLILALMTLAAPARSQSRPMSPTDRTDPAKIRMEEDSRRELELSSRGATNQPPRNTKELEAVAARVQTNFERILALHNQMVQQITTGAPVDYRFLSDASGEIKKRAGQLQTALVLPRPDSQTADQPLPKFDDTQIKEAMLLFCKRIESFVKNPIIETPGTVDTLQAARARRDLQDVVDLADRIKRMADRLKRTSN